KGSQLFPFLIIVASRINYNTIFLLIIQQVCILLHRAKYENFNSEHNVFLYLKNANFIIRMHEIMGILQNRLRYYIGNLTLVALFFIIQQKAFAQVNSVEFGKNRVQYEKFKWRYYQTRNFNVYFSQDRKSTRLNSSHVKISYA